MKYNIAIIGAGQLGSRHLQSLSLVNRPLNILVVDPNHASLETSRQRWNEVKDDKDHSIQFVEDIAALPSDLFLVIVATGSMVRRKVIESLLQVSIVKYLVLEKVLFPSIEDYTVINEKLSEKGVKAWVNCPRRLYEGYRKLKKEISDASFIMGVNGSLWGLACNSIHWIDIFSYLAGDSNIEVIPFLDNEVFPSKRPGYMELSGSLMVANASGSKLIMQCFPTGKHPLETHLEFPDSSYFIQEAKEKIGIRMGSKDWVEKTEDFPVPRQSQLSHLFVNELLDQGNCSLTPYDESFKLHLPLLNVFLKKINTYQNTPENKICPIT